MGKIILVTGGARSGKSTFAEEIALKKSKKPVYIATATPFDNEMKDRIKHHLDRRGDKFHTVECYKEIPTKVNELKQKVFLLDCLTVMTSNLMFEVCPDFDAITPEISVEIETIIRKELIKTLEYFKNKKGSRLIIVTNELGMGIVPDTVAGRVYRDIAGRANQTAARFADQVHLVVSGIPIRIK